MYIFNYQLSIINYQLSIMSKVILTRYLYLFDEVGLSFISSLLKAQTLNESYFWISELYLSGFIEQSWDLIWFVYYDFYYIMNPQFESFICKKATTGDLKSILTVVKNLFKLSSSSQVFITRQYNNNIKDITHIFKGKKPNWLMSIPSKYHGLFRFIDKKLYHFAVSSLPDVIEPDLFQAIQTYFKITDEERLLFQAGFTFDGTGTGTGTVADGDSVDEPLCRNQYANDVHKVWAIICLLMFHPQYIQSATTNKKKIYIACGDGEYDEIIKHHTDPIPLSKNNNQQIYKTLEVKRLYTIDPICASFKLLRENVQDMNTCYWYHWEYYANTCPLWAERFNQYNITIDDESAKITFNDDDQMEDFYSKYGYEPDEQSNETESKRIIKMDSHNWKKWYESVFSQKPIYEFNDDFRFSY
jgi:hypothetical protein